ncbi:MAG: hypothetical protein AABZ60_08340, partial [Planctomycetota bacterium]
MTVLLGFIGAFLAGGLYNLARASWANLAFDLAVAVLLAATILFFRREERARAEAASRAPEARTFSAAV